MALASYGGWQWKLWSSNYQVFVGLVPSQWLLLERLRVANLLNLWGIMLLCPLESAPGLRSLPLWILCLVPRPLQIRCFMKTSVYPFQVCVEPWVLLLIAYRHSGPVLKEAYSDTCKLVRRLYSKLLSWGSCLLQLERGMVSVTAGMLSQWAERSLVDENSWGD
jgi:hypothetical protein